MILTIKHRFTSFQLWRQMNVHWASVSENVNIVPADDLSKVGAMLGMLLSE